jgi:hypothetical protein
MSHRDPEEGIHEQQGDTVMREVGDRPAGPMTPRYHRIIEHGATLRAERDALWAYIETLEDELRTWGLPWGGGLLTSVSMPTIDERIDELRRQHGLGERKLPSPSLADNR